MPAYVCQVCDREFKSRGHLNRHFKLHELNKKPKSPDPIYVISSDEEVSVKDIQGELEELLKFNHVPPTNDTINLYTNFEIEDNFLISDILGEGCSSINAENIVIENPGTNNAFEQDIMEGIRDLINDIYKEEEVAKMKEEEEVKRKEEEEEVKRKQEKKEEMKKKEEEEVKKKEEIEKKNRIKEVVDQKREKAALILMKNKLRKLKRGEEINFVHWLKKTFLKSK